MTRFKVDENLPDDVTAFLRAAGHDALSVGDHKMIGVPDRMLADVCLSEGRAIVTPDLDFADIRMYPPEGLTGIIVLRPRRQDKLSVLALVQSVLPLLETEPLVGRLWVVDETAVRIRGGA